MKVFINFSLIAWYSITRLFYWLAITRVDFVNQSCLLQRCPLSPLPGTKTILFSYPKALLGHLTILINEWAKFISDLPLSSLYSVKIPRVPVLCSSPFSNFVQLRVPLVQCISSPTSKVPVS